MKEEKQAGRSAYQRFIPLDQNPYPIGTTAYHLWRSGWRLARHQDGGAGEREMEQRQRQAALRAWQARQEEEAQERAAARAAEDRERSERRLANLRARMAEAPEEFEPIPEPEPPARPTPPSEPTPERPTPRHSGRGLLLLTAALAMMSSFQPEPPPPLRRK